MLKELVCPTSPPPGASSEELGEYLSSLQEWMRTTSAKNATLSEKKAACEDATQELARQREQCNQAQSIYESRFCEYRQFLTSTCSKYDTCRASASEVLDNVTELAESSSATLKIQYTSVKLVVCFVDVLQASDEEQGAQLQHCNQLNVSTSSLDITRREAPKATDCNTSLVSMYPCGSQWLEDHYTSKEWFSLAPAASCTACNIISGGSSSGGGGSSGNA